MDVDTAIQTYVTLPDTELCTLLASYGDRGVGYHQYSRFYSALLEPIRTESFSLLQVGVGPSLIGWRDYLPNANIVGVDIREESLFQDNRIQTYTCNTEDSTSVQELFNSNELQSRQFRIILDDGINTNTSRANVFNAAFDKLEQGGLYILEDFAIEGRGWEIGDFVERVQVKYPDIKCHVLLVEPTGYRPNDNKILLIKKE